MRKVSLPEKIVFDIDKADAKDAFNVGLATFRSEWKPSQIEELRAITDKVSAGKKLSDIEISLLSDRRAFLKHMRYLFQAVSRDHEVPEELDELAVSLGKVRDNTTFEMDEAAMKSAKRFRKALKPENLKKLEEGFAHFKPSHAGDFEDWLVKETAASLKTARKGKGTFREFHMVRKNLQAMLAVVEHQLLRDQDNAVLNREYKGFVRVTELFGGEVDRLTLAADEKKFDLDTEVFDFNNTPVGRKAVIEAIDLLERVQRGLGHAN